MIVVRYADDTVVGFEHRADAERFLAELRIRMAEFALELHPEKTRLIEFGRNAASDRAAAGRANRRPSTSWASPTSARDRNGAASGWPGTRGATGSRRSCWRSPRTSGDAGTRTWPNRARGWERGAGLLCLPRRAHQHARPVGVPPPCRRYSGDAPCAGAARGTARHGRDGQAGGSLAAQAPDIPPLAAQRFRVKHPRWEPYAGMPHVRFCAGGAP